MRDRLQDGALRHGARRRPGALGVRRRRGVHAGERDRCGGRSDDRGRGRSGAHHRGDSRRMPQGHDARGHPRAGRPVTPQPVIGEEMRSYYDRRAPDYDDWWLDRGQFEQRKRPGWVEEVEALVRMVNSLAPARVLDVACGTGFLTRHLRGDVVGLDQSEAMLAIAAERAPRVRLVKAEAVPLPFGDGEFDRLFTSHFYGHLLEEERKAFLAEARRAAREV